MVWLFAKKKINEEEYRICMAEREVTCRLAGNDQSVSIFTTYKCKFAKKFVNWKLSILNNYNSVSIANYMLQSFVLNTSFMAVLNLTQKEDIKCHRIMKSFDYEDL